MSQRTTPDRAALEIAHRRLKLVEPLDQLMQSKALRLILENVARDHMQRRGRFDVKKLQSNDLD